MDFLSKAKRAAEQYAGGDASHSHRQTAHPKGKATAGGGSVVAQAAQAAEKYHAKEKIVEFVQQRGAKHDPQEQSGDGAKKDKSAIEKAVEKAEGFLAKQSGQEAKGHGHDAADGKKKEDKHKGEKTRF